MQPIPDHGERSGTSTLDRLQNGASRYCMISVDRWPVPNTMYVAATAHSAFVLRPSGCADLADAIRWLEFQSARALLHGFHNQRLGRAATPTPIAAG
jgi:hypothetical protein